MISNRIVQKNRVSGAVNNNNRWGWGTNSYKLIQNNNTGTFSSPVQSDHASGPTSWIMVSHGNNFSCGIDDTNKLWCWGLNNFGQLGINSSPSMYSPVQVGTGNWTQVSCGSDHVLALNDNKKLFSWGRNNRGQLGDGTSVNRSSPVQVNSNNWIKISAGHSFSAAITEQYTAKGYLYTWGFNNFGQLGDGTTNTRYTPVKIVYGSYPAYQFIDVSAGYEHCLAAMEGYNFFLAWGRGDVGQLGNGNTGNSSVPLRATHGQSMKKVEASGDNSAFIDNSDLLYVFGANNYGQLGNNNTNYQVSPIGFLTSYYISDVQFNAKSKSKVTTFVINFNSRIFSCGLGDYFLLGNGSNTSISSPVQVGTATNWVQLSRTGGIGSEFMLALKG